MNPTSVVIPVAGCGIRLRSKYPKCLSPLFGETILTRQLRLIRERWPDTPIYAVVGYGCQYFACLLDGVTRVVNDDHERTNTAQSVLLAMQVLPPGQTLILYGDLVFSRETLRDMDLPAGNVLYGEHSQLRSSEVGLVVTESYVTHISYGLPLHWAQFALLDDSGRAAFMHHMQTAGARRFLAYEVFNRMLVGGVPLQYRPLPGWLVEVDATKDLGAARLAIRLHEEIPDGAGRKPRKRRKKCT